MSQTAMPTRFGAHTTRSHLGTWTPYAPMPLPPTFDGIRAAGTNLPATTRGLMLSSVTFRRSLS